MTTNQWAYDIGWWFGRYNPTADQAAVAGMRRYPQIPDWVDGVHAGIRDHALDVLQYRKPAINHRLAAWRALVHPNNPPQENPTP